LLALPEKEYRRPPARWLQALRDWHRLEQERLKIAPSPESGDGRFLQRTLAGAEEVRARCRAPLGQAGGLRYRAEKR
jgi:hypothetical protein